MTWQEIAVSMRAVTVRCGVIALATAPTEPVRGEALIEALAMLQTCAQSIERMAEVLA